MSQWIPNNSLELPESKKEQASSYPAPVQRLNADVLRLIVMEAVNSDPYNEMAMKCSLVCRFWAETVLNTPTAWSKIYLGEMESVEKLHLHVTRARSAPLSIEINSRARTAEYIKEIVNVSHQLESLTIQIRLSHRYDLINSIRRTTTFPNTRYLWIWGPRSHAMPHALSILFGNQRVFPNLTTLAVSILRVIVRKLLPTFPYLRRLYLHSCVFIGLEGADFGHLQEFLCHNLTISSNETLDLKSVTRLRYTCSQTSIWEMAPRIRAPKLVSFEYTGHFPIELLGETQYLKELHFTYQFGQYVARDPTWSRGSVTSMSISFEKDSFKEFIGNSTDLPPSLKRLNLRGVYSEELFESPVSALEKRSIAVTIIGSSEIESDDMTYW